MIEPKYPWDTLHHCSFLIPEKTFIPSSTQAHDICAIESKYFLPPGKVDWIKNPIPTPDAFEEGNMSNISPTIKVNISKNTGKFEDISRGAACSPEGITAYTSLFQEYKDMFVWDYLEMPGISPTIVEHHIETWHDAHPIQQKKCQLHPSKVATIK